MLSAQTVKHFEVEKCIIPIHVSCHPEISEMGSLRLFFLLYFWISVVYIASVTPTSPGDLFFQHVCLFGTEYHAAVIPYTSTSHFYFRFERLN
jgi:hypothetical protein